MPFYCVLFYASYNEEIMRNQLLFHLILIGFAATSLAQDSRSTIHEEGLRENRPSAYALTGATVVVAPGQSIDNASIVIRDGKIQAVIKEGGDLPEDVRILDMSGKTIYAGLIDAYSETEVADEKLTIGAPYWNSNIRPQILASQNLELDEQPNESLREHGITARLIVPAGGIIKGQSAIVTTGDESTHGTLVRDQVAQHARLTVSRRFGASRGSRPSYPNSPMGAVALARQAMYDAQWYKQANEAVLDPPTVPRPNQNDALAALRNVIDRKQPLVIDSSNELYFLRAHRFANEFNVKAIIKGNGFEFRRLDEIVATGRPILLPVDFPAAPNVTSYEASLNVSLETLMEWDHAPENPARLDDAGVEFAFTSAGLEDQKEFLDNIRKAVSRGLNKESALKALTVTPANLFGLSHLLGSIERGKLANLVVADGDLFDEKTKINETWVSGVRYENEKQPALDLSGKWKLESEDQKGKPVQLELKLTSDKDSVSGSIQALSTKPQKKKSAKKTEDKESEEAESEENETKLSKAGVQNKRLSVTFDAKEYKAEGTARLTFVFDQGTDKAEGFLTHPDGTRSAATIIRLKDSSKDADESGQESSNSKSAKDSPVKATFAVNFPLGAYGRSQPAAKERLWIKNVTIWTCSDAGIIQDGSVLVEGGKITKVGKDLKVSPADDLVVVDGKGMHLTPGIIDCHSHMASDGGINESGQAITAEVRIGDFINCNDINIYRQLAGGVTSSNILHGSANPIGGQNQVIKLRWGMMDEDLKFAEAPQGIKFALGENVKRSRDRESTRYPRTRMGVEQIFRDEFRAAKGYEQEWKRWQKSKTGLPPRRDLELDAIVEILNRERWIHCHSYRQDEILALIRLLDGFKIQIGTFQHILEGYKVADAMKKHGAMGSAFADWWAYKFEVYDAIPYAGALMHNAGVVVSFNSDDRELARHLNHEAAKAVKYGGVPPEEALKFVTLNPAKQLRIDQYVGSIEAGKHADLVLWNGDPLSTLSRCEKTWVDGMRMFDREVDQKQQAEFEKMKQVLIQKVLASGEKMSSMQGGRKPKQAELWPNYDEFCRCKGANR